MPADLRTARLLLRGLTAADAGWLAALHGDPSVMRFIDDGEPVPARVTVLQALPRMLRDYGTLPAGLGVLAAERIADGAQVGWFSLRPPSSVGLGGYASAGPGGAVELGYRLFPSAWGRGYATEGARALVRQAFADLGAGQVVATTMTVNAASRRVLEKAGLSLVRTFFAQWPAYLEGAEHGDVVYAISRREWLGRG